MCWPAGVYLVHRRDRAVLEEEGGGEHAVVIHAARRFHVIAENLQQELHLVHGVEEDAS